MNAPVPIAMGPVPSSEGSTAIPESSTNPQIEESKKRKREKSYSKCNQCRTDKQKCVEGPDLPLNMCKRCHDKNLHCSGPVEMAKGRPRKSKDESQIDSQDLLCYLSLLGPALRSIRDYESKMAKLCDFEDIEEILQDEGELFWFLECIGNLRRCTHDTILNTIDPGTTSQRRNPSFADSGLRQLLLLQNLALQSDGLVDCSLKWREYRRELAERCSRPEHIGESYTLQLEVCSTSSDKSDWEKLFDLRDQFQERLLLIFDPLKEEFWISPMLLRSPLPFPEIYNSTVEKISHRRDCLGRTLLHALLDTTDYWYLLQGSLVEMLDSAPEDIDAKDIFGRTVLYTACEHGRYKAAVELLARKADPQLPTILGLTPLHIAAASGHTSICNLLLQHGQCDIDSPNELYGWTPLCYAARHGHYDVVQLLLDHKGVDVNHRGILKRTPLRLAVVGYHLGVLKLLGRHDEVVHDTRDEHGGSALHHAVDDEFVDGLKYLLEVLQLDPNCKTDDGTTPLMLAANQDIIEIVRLLVKDSRTWLLTRNDRSKSAFDLYARPEICGMLEATLEARWGGDRDIVAEHVLKWPAIRASGVFFGQSPSDVSSLFDDLHSDFMESLMRFFEEKGVLGWANASAEHWASAMLLLQGKMFLLQGSKLMAGC
ncbi:hypothetical protein EG328_005508 [Venturia inaequalis]|uniref:Zn(2)-C6 fungal-type domain-containing protein n=1 Tax=Venturia inaequalis TaxID=5025 RepID=A0A8H3YTN2_VENIN|nr:hypothetical protein EG328_005508 [Venturia inaequalis]RDI77805.1 hypothetical protein Vi05172_g12244 [Venturia inaequalis]